MAKVTIRTKGDDTKTYFIRLTINRKLRFEKSTLITIDVKDWSSKTDLPKNNGAKRKVITDRLVKIQSFILNEYNEETEKDKVNSKWLGDKVKKFQGMKIETDLPKVVTYWIQHRVDHPTYRNKNNEIKTLSKGRLRHYRNLKTLIEDFEQHNDTSLNVEDCNQNIFDEFLNYLYDELEMTGQTSAKRASDLKTVCRYAQSKGVKVAEDFNTIAFGSGKTYDNDMDVIYLSFDELEKIQSLELHDENLINARKWLIALCYTGQRGGDLIGNTSKGTKSQLNNNRLKSIAGNLVLEVTQEKGNKKVNVPVLPPVQELFDTGLPPQMTLQSVRKHFKEIGKLADIDEPTMGRKIEATENGKRGIKKVRPKYEYLSTHTGRRSFATNFENDTDMPRTLIMNITGHAKESTFLKYINKANDAHVEKTFEAYAKAMAKQKAKASKKAPMEVLKGA